MNEFCYWLRAKLDIWLARFDPWSGDDNEVCHGDGEYHCCCTEPCDEES